MPSLAEFQREFAATLLAPAAGAVADRSAAALRVHRNTVMKGLVDALLANFPTLAVLMGIEWLTDVARAYAMRHPPRHAVLADYGDSFPDFLRTSGVDRDWPYLSGVAELDRAWTQSLLARDERVLAPERLAGLGPDSLGSIHLRLHPAAHYGVHAHSAVSVWQANRPPAVPPAELAIADVDEAALIVRTGDGVMLLPLEAPGRAFIESVIAGCDMATAAASALVAAPDADFAAIWSSLLIHGVFADLE